MTRWIPGLVAGLVATCVIVAEATACSSSRSSTFGDGEPDASGAQGALVDGSSGPAVGDETMLFGEAQPTCTNLQCQQVDCGPGGDTTVSGTVYAPNGTLPIYNAIVYVPNAPLDPMTEGITCDRCGAISSGNPIVTALSDATGHFVLHNAPAGPNIPLVVQLGKWRRSTTIPSVAQCTETKLTDPNLTRLPKNQKEGNMPHIALTTGTCDQVGCMLPKLGIDTNEFGFESDGFNKAINVFAGDDNGAFPATSGITPADDLWGNLKVLHNYDVAILSCECSEALDSKGNTYTAHEFDEVRKYLDSGGRIFTTDFQYTWYKYSTDPNMGGGNPSGPAAGIGQIPGGAPDGFDPITLDTSFPKGKALADWLAFVFANALDAGSYGQVSADFVFANVNSLVASKSQTWASSAAGLIGLAGPRVFTVNTPVGLPVDQQCGKGVHLDAHINDPSSVTVGASNDIVGCNGSICYPQTCIDPLKEDEAMFAFFFFDLSSCIQNDAQPPTPPR